MPPFIQLERKQWAEFQKQIKAAAGDASDIKDLWSRILEPMRAEWARRLPGSLGRTPKVRRKSASGEIWAGFASTKPDRPFLPWLEFGGTVKWKADPRNQFERVPLPFGFRMRKVMYIKRPRVPEGRWLGPTVEGKTDDVAREFADGIQSIFNKHLGGGTFRL